MMMKKSVVGAICAVLGLAAGFAAGVLARGEATAPEAAPESPLAKERVPPRGEEESLRARIRILEERLAAAKAPAAPVETRIEEPPPGEPPRREDRRGRHGPPRPPTAEELAEMEKNDPERYVQTTNFMAHMARRMERDRRRQAERNSIIAGVNTELLTPEQQEVHNRYQDLTAQMEALRENFRPDAEGVTDEEREANFRAMHELGRELGELAAAERENLVSAAIYSFGLEGDDAAELAETIKSVYDATQTGHGPDRGGPPHRR